MKAEWNFVVVLYPCIYLCTQVYISIERGFGTLFLGSGLKIAGTSTVRNDVMVVRRLMIMVAIKKAKRTHTSIG